MAKPAIALAGFPWTLLGRATLSRNFLEHGGHGADVRLPVGTWIPAPRLALVEYVGWVGPRDVSDGRSLGYSIVLYDAAARETWLFGHNLKRYVVRAGDVVLPGQFMVASGNTGHSTGPHSHIERLALVRWPRKGRFLDPFAGTPLAARAAPASVRSSPPIARPRGWWYL